MFEARGIDFATYEKEEPIHDATGAGRGYAVAGGVASAVEQCIREYYPDLQFAVFTLILRKLYFVQIFFGQFFGRIADKLFYRSRPFFYGNIRARASRGENRACGRFNGMP